MYYWSQVGSASEVSYILLLMDSENQFVCAYVCVFEWECDQTPRINFNETL